MVCWLFVSARSNESEEGECEVGSVVEVMRRATQNAGSRRRSDVRIARELVSLLKLGSRANLRDMILGNGEISNKKRPETRIDKLSLENPPDLLEHKLLYPTHILQ